MLVSLLTSWAVEVRNTLGAVETEGSQKSILRIVEELTRSFQDMVDRAKVHSLSR